MIIVHLKRAHSNARLQWGKHNLPYEEEWVWKEYANPINQRKD